VSAARIARVYNGSMGIAKDREIEKDDNWVMMCRAKGWTCKVCGAVPPERGKPFDGDVCGYCNRALEKD
jgi:hypothetical protein